MFFEKENLSFNILDVVRLDQKNSRTVNSRRNFDALSFRFSADTQIHSSRGDFRLGDGDVCFVPANLNYARNALRDELIVVHFTTGNWSFSQIEHFSPRAPQVFAELFGKIYKIWNEKDVGYFYRAAALFCEILAECYRENYRLMPNESSVGKIDSAVNYLNLHFTDPNLRISDAAEMSFVSEIYFRKLFLEKYGVSPKKYLVTLKIQRAAELIAEGYHSLKEVAALSGYPDYQYFCTQFKRVKGVSPSEYKYNY